MIGLTRLPVLQPPFEPDVIGPPKHCCGVWPCEFVTVVVGSTAEFQCGSGGPVTPFPALGGRVLKRVANDVNYHRWEYRSESEAPGVIYEITLECDRTQERRDEGYGPCIEITLKYDNTVYGPIGTAGVCVVCFGPTVMNDRVCDCVNPIEYDQPSYQQVGFAWGNSYISGDVINNDPTNGACEETTCQFILDGGDSIEAVCLCSEICNCYGIKKQLHLVWECPTFSDIEVDLDWYDADNFPSCASAPPDWSAGGAWWGTAPTGISGCTLEVQLQCTLTSFDPDGLFIILHDPDVSACFELCPATDCCDAYELACTSPNLVIQSDQCRSESDDFQLVFAFCNVSGEQPCCDGTDPDPPCSGANNLVSIITITERD